MLEASVLYTISRWELYVNVPNVHVEVVKIEVECKRAATVCKGRSRGRTDGAKNTRVRFKQRKYVSGQF